MLPESPITADEYVALCRAGLRPDYNSVGIEAASALSAAERLDEAHERLKATRPKPGPPEIARGIHPGQLTIDP